MNCWVIFYITMIGIWRQSVEELLPWPMEEFSGCFGSVHHVFLTPTCNVSERIVIDALYAMTKPNEMNCPAEMTNLTGDQFNRCCVYDEGDCTEVYHGEAYINYYEKFTGKPYDIKPVSRQDANSCNATNYPPQTNYMLLKFYCITESVISGFENNPPITAPTVYLANTDYPDSIQGSSSSVTCTVSASCNTTILITVIDLSLHNDSTGCSQSLDVIDGNNTITFNCDDNNQYKIKIIYTSSSHFIKVVFNNSKQVNNGTLWLQFNATSYANVTLSCGSSVESTAPAVNACVIPETTTPTTTTQTTTTPTTTTQTTENTPSNKNVKDNPAGLRPEILALAILLPLVLLVLIITGSVFYYKKTKKQQPDGEQGVINRIPCFGSLFSSNVVASVPEPTIPNKSATCDSERLISDNNPPQIDFETLPTEGRGNSLPPIVTQQTSPETTNVLSFKPLPPVEE